VEAVLMGTVLRLAMAWY